MGLACRLRWRLSASWYELGLTGWFVGWAGQVAGRWAGCLPCRGTASGQAVGLGWRWRPVGRAGLGKLRSWLLAGASWAGQVGWPAGLDRRLVGAYWAQAWPGFFLWAERSGGRWCRAAWLGKLPIGQKQATEECENKGSDLFRNYWIYEAMFRCNGENKGLLPLAASAKALADVQLDAF